MEVKYKVKTAKDKVIAIFLQSSFKKFFQFIYLELEFLINKILRTDQTC